jgi:bla regulator protein BlaR1
MTIAWMIYVLLVGVLLAVGAVCVEEAMRAAKLPTRWVWAAALLTTVGFAGYALRNSTVPAGTVSQINGSVGNVVSVPTQSPHGLAVSIDAMRAAIAQVTAWSVSAVSVRVPSRLVTAALVLWAAVSVVLLLVHIGVSARVIRQRRAWPIAELPGGIARVAPALGPAVIGLASPEIVVPEWLLEKSEEEQRLVMVHEQEHIAARDQYLPFGALLVATLLPWHPAVWWSLARLRLAVELDCDARVLRRGERPQSYGTLLIDIAAQCGGHRAGAVALADRTSHLERRILAMTPRTARFSRVRSSALVALAALAVLGACEARVPTSTEIATMDVSAAERAATAVLLPAAGGSMTYDYIVDDKPMTEADARAIPGSRIASVSMAKPARAEAGAKGLVTIHTVEYAEAHPAVRVQSHQAQNGATRVPTDMYIPYGKDAPLVVVDGVIAEQNVITKLRSTDIESVEVLKGAAAKAAWSHPAAANGVITIKTKHAK